MNGQPKVLTLQLTPCDFFLWVCLQEQAYSAKPRNLEELEGRIHKVLTSIAPELPVKYVVHGRL